MLLAVNAIKRKSAQNAVVQKLIRSGSFYARQFYRLHDRELIKKYAPADKQHSHNERSRYYDNIDIDARRYRSVQRCTAENQKKYTAKRDKTDRESDTRLFTAVFRWKFKVIFGEYCLV